MRSWLRPHRGLSQASSPDYLGFFEFGTTQGNVEKGSWISYFDSSLLNNPESIKSQKGYV
jgi:hypothetical protein